MTLPASGTLTLLEIKNRYGGPGNLRSYYYGGSYVTSNSSNGTGHTIPSSGVIAQANFYGAGYYAGATFYTDTVGSGSNTVPYGATTACIEIIGGGGGGGCTSNSAGTTLPSGGGGGYAQINVAVTGGQTFNYVCGTGGVGATTGDITGSNGTITTLTRSGGLSMNALPGLSGPVSGTGGSQISSPGSGGSANGSTGVNTINGSTGSGAAGGTGGSPGFNFNLPAGLYVGSGGTNAGTGGDHEGANAHGGDGAGGGAGYVHASGGSGGNGTSGLIVITYT